MKTVGVRALRENPGILSQAARDGDMVLVTNRSAPISLSVPFDDDLLKSGVHVNTRHQQTTKTDTSGSLSHK